MLLGYTSIAYPQIKIAKEEIKAIKAKCLRVKEYYSTLDMVQVKNHSTNFRIAYEYEIYCNDCAVYNKPDRC